MKRASKTKTLLSIYIDKQLQRVSKNSLQKLDNKDVVKVFPSVLVSDGTVLVLKKPKTRTSIRRVWLPETVARSLVEWKKQQEEMKEIFRKTAHIIKKHIL